VTAPPQGSLVTNKHPQATKEPKNDITEKMLSVHHPHLKQTSLNWLILTLNKGTLHLGLASERELDELEVAKL
jgi:hypothetical protein